MSRQSMLRGLSAVGKRHWPWVRWWAFAALMTLSLVSCFRMQTIAEEPATVAVVDDSEVSVALGTVSSSSRDQVKERWGVELEGVRLTALGAMLDVRFTVLDSELASPLFDRRAKAHLVHSDSGLAASIPVPAKIGPLRQTLTVALPVEGRVYFMLFGNPGGRVHAGDTVTLEVGDFRAEGLMVR